MRDKILKHLPKILSVLLLAGLVLAYFFIPEAQQFFDEAWKVLSGGDEQEIKNWIASFGWAGPVVLITDIFLAFDVISEVTKYSNVV